MFLNKDRGDSNLWRIIDLEDSGEIKKGEDISSKRIVIWITTRKTGYEEILNYHNEVSKYIFSSDSRLDEYFYNNSEDRIKVGDVRLFEIEVESSVNCIVLKEVCRY